MKHTNDVFILCSGQDDNIGDTVLRRRMLSSLLQTAKCNIYVGDASSGFVEALSIPDNHFVFTDYRTWLQKLYVSSIRGTASLILKPGEMDISLTRNYLAERLSILPASILIRLKGHAIQQVGVGLRAPSSSLTRVTRLQSALVNHVVWRDTTSFKLTGFGSVMPDWGFDENIPHRFSEEDNAGRFIAVTVRFDRPFPSDSLIDALKAVAQTLGCEIVVVVQVHRDNQRNEELARILRARFFPWTDQTHIEQEKLVREVYRQSRLVLSDRLHALIVGLTEGAIPIGTLMAPDLKIGRHFRAAGIDNMSFDVSNWQAETVTRTILSIAERSEEFHRAAQEARTTIKAVETEMIDRISRK